MAEPIEEVFLRLPPDLVEEVFYRLPPDELCCLFRASAVCKPWRRILVNPGFRHRYREFHRTALILGVFDEHGHFVPTSAPLPAQPDHPDRILMDCRHGRVLFVSGNGGTETSDLVVLDPVTGHHQLIPFPCNRWCCFSAAVLCAGQSCDHHGCQGGHFRVAVVCPKELDVVTLGWLYSSETRLWTELTSVHHPKANYFSNMATPSVLVGDALYFNIDGIIECQLGTLRLSMFERPVDGNGILMTAEDRRLGFASVVDVTILTLWSRDTAGLEGAMGWAKLRVIDLKTLLPDGALLIPPEYGISMLPRAWVSGFAEGTQVIFVSTLVGGSYMVDLMEERVRKVSYTGRKFFPYTSFYIPAMNAVPIDQGQ